VVGTAIGVSPHSGSFQAATINGFGSISQTLATTPGQSYTLDFWAASVGPRVGGNVLAVHWNGSTFSHVFGAGTQPYTEFTFNVTAANASTDLTFVLSNHIFLDDISVTPVGVPDGGSTVSLLSFALLGVAVLRQKLRCQGLGSFVNASRQPLLRGV
jgi:hypothetical protein